MQTHILRCRDPRAADRRSQAALQCSRSFPSFLGGEGGATSRLQADSVPGSGKQRLEQQAHGTYGSPNAEIGELGELSAPGASGLQRACNGLDVGRYNLVQELSRVSGGGMPVPVPLRLHRSTEGDRERNVPG